MRGKYREEYRYKMVLGEQRGVESNKSESTTVSSQAPNSLIKACCPLMWREKGGHRETARW